MFENVSGEAAIRVLRGVVQDALAIGYQTCLIPKTTHDTGGRQLHPFLSRSKYATHEGCRTVLPSELPRIAELFYEFGVATLGPTLWRQSGTPIGGIASAGMTNLFLSSLESLFATTREHRQNLGLFLPWTGLLTSMRYVDDLVTASASLCWDCLSKISLLPYGRTVPWEDAPRSPPHVWNKWLDVMIRPSSQDPFMVEMAPAVPVDPLTIVPSSEDHVRYAVPPCVDDSNPSEFYLSGLARCRISRLIQLPFRGEMVRDAVIAEMRMWKFRGFSSRRIIQTWTTAAQLSKLKKTCCAYSMFE